MDQIMGKAGSYFFTQKASKEMGTVTDEINKFSNSVEGGANWLVNKIKGQVQKPLPDLLKEHDLPIGIFPQKITNYEFDGKTRYLTVFLPSVCEVEYMDSSLLRFNTEVSGYLDKAGKLTNVQGMKTKMVMLWVKVTLVSAAEESSKIQFTAGIKTVRRRDAYEVVKDGVATKNF